MQRLKLLIPSTIEKIGALVTFNVYKIVFIHVTFRKYKEQKIRIHIPNFWRKWKIMK